MDQQKPLTVDPDNIPELVCVGQFNVWINGPLATLTLTHARPKVAPMVDQNRIEIESVVRARIVTTVDNLVALKDLLNTLLIETPNATSSSSGSSLLN